MNPRSASAKSAVSSNGRVPRCSRCAASMTAVGGFWSMSQILPRRAPRRCLTGAMDVRRVVTGHDASGKSVFVSDEAVAPRGRSVTRLRFTCCGAVTRHRSSRTTGRCRSGTPTFRRSAASGSRCSRCPRDRRGRGRAISTEEQWPTAEQKLPGLVGYMDPDDPGMHTTDTIDFEVVLEGTVILELDDGAEVTLHPGDTVVQNGTRHRWQQPGRHACPAGAVRLRRVARKVTRGG